MPVCDEAYHGLRPKRTAFLITQYALHLIHSSTQLRATRYVLPTTLTTEVYTTSDIPRLYRFLQRDPIFGAYAIGDLEAAQMPYCTWYLAQVTGQAEPEALLLLYHRLDPPIVLTQGSAAGVAALLQQVDLPARAFFSAAVEHQPLLAARFQFDGDELKPMLRMAVSSQAFSPSEALPDGAALRRLAASDAPAVTALIALGGPFAPDAFDPVQITEGVFYGAADVTGALLAVAGTHLVSPGRGVAALGNVYTHPQARGRGLASLVSSAVTADLLAAGLQVVLNVNQRNPAARHIYEKLGYVVHGPFLEGVGTQADK